MASKQICVFVAQKRHPAWQYGGISGDQKISKTITRYQKPYQKLVKESKRI